MDFPGWLEALAIASLAVGALCAVVIGAMLIIGPRQRMAVMNLVWPLTALYAGPLAVWGFVRTRPRLSMKPKHPGGMGGMQMAERSGDEGPPTPSQTAISVSHCGAGCTLGDIVGEIVVAALALGFFISERPTGLLVDFVFAFLFGIAFQYWSIMPMRKLSPAAGLVAALRADTLSITAFQLGMVAWMLLVRFAILTDPKPSPGDPVFWLMMQIAMLVGFATSYPVNVWLLRRGWKERMG